MDGRPPGQCREAARGQDPAYRSTRPSPEPLTSTDARDHASELRRCLLQAPPRITGNHRRTRCVAGPRRAEDGPRERPDPKAAGGPGAGEVAPLRPPRRPGEVLRALHKGDPRHRRRAWAQRAPSGRPSASRGRALTGVANGDRIVVLAARPGQTESGVAGNVEHTCVQCSNPLSLSDHSARRPAEFYCCWECEAEITGGGPSRPGKVEQLRAGLGLPEWMIEGPRGPGAA